MQSSFRHQVLDFLHYVMFVWLHQQFFALPLIDSLYYNLLDLWKKRMIDGYPMILFKYMKLKDILNTFSLFVSADGCMWWGIGWKSSSMSYIDRLSTNAILSLELLLTSCEQRRIIIQNHDSNKLWKINARRFKVEEN